MSNKCIFLLFLVGIITFSICILSYFILGKICSYRIYFLLLFLSTALMLPQSFHDLKNDRKRTVQDWRILVSNIIGVIFTFISFLICLSKGI